MKEYDYVLLGGNLCTLVLANELSSTGKHIALVAPENTIGGHFSEYSSVGFNFDLGMVLLEFDSYMEQVSDLSLYDDDTLGLIGAFSDVVEAYLKKIIKYKHVNDIVVSKNGKIIPDYFISNDLSGLNDIFTPDEESLIKKQLEDCILENDYHPQNKATSSKFNQVSFSDCSISNHGQFLHSELLEPLVKKVTGLSSEFLLGKYHRLFWAPMYYPETLLEQFKNRQMALRPTQFSYPDQGNIATIVKSLYQKVLDNRGIDVYQNICSLSKNKTSWILNNEINSPKLVSSLPQHVLASLLNIDLMPLVKTSYALIFMKVEGVCDFNVLTNADENFLFFRIVNNSRLQEVSGRFSYVVVECNYDYVVAQDSTYFDNKVYIKELESFLSEYGVIDSPSIIEEEVVYLKNKLAFPTPSNLSATQQNLIEFNEINNLFLMGPSLGMGAASMNQQIVQALKFASSEGVNSGRLCI